MKLLKIIYGLFEYSMNIKEIMEKSLFLTGAGATMEAGCKTSREMIADLEKNFGTENEKEALSFLLSSLEYHSKWKSLQGDYFTYQSNIEDLVVLLRRISEREYLLPYPITGSWSDKLLLLESKEPKIFSSLRKNIQNKLAEWLVIDKEDTKFLKPISDFFREVTDEEIILDIFTLNYDLVFEKKFNSPPETLVNIGFTSGSWVGFSDAKLSSHRINYYKLHGSFNWLKNKEDGSVILNDFEMANKNNYNQSIIFGQGNKLLSVEPFISLIYEFKELLQEKDYYFIIGYSFYDPYINNLIFEALTKHPEKNKQLIIINPLNEFVKSLSPNPDEESIKVEYLKYISSIQTKSFLSELPEFNVTKISPSLVRLERMKTGDFIKSYFYNRGEKFINLMEEIKEEKAGVF